MNPIVKRFLRFAIAAIGLAIIFREVPASRVAEVFRVADWRWVLAAFVVAALAQPVLAERLRLLTNAFGLPLSLVDILDINLTTRFYALFLPGGGVTAGAVRVFRLARARGDYGAGVTAVALDRITTTAAQCHVGIVFGLLAWRPGQVGWLAIVALAGAFLTAPFLWLYVRRRKPPIPSRFVPDRLAARLATLADGLATMPRAHWKWLAAWSLAAHLIGTIEYLFLARALGIDAGFAVVGWIRSVMLLATAIPITVSGLGLREGAAVLVFRDYGISAESALAFSLLVFATSHLAMGSIGALFEAFRRPPR